MAATKVLAGQEEGLVWGKFPALCMVKNAQQCVERSVQQYKIIMIRKEGTE